MKVSILKNDGISAKVIRCKKTLDDAEHYAYLHDFWASNPIGVAEQKKNIKKIKMELKTLQIIDKIATPFKKLPF